MWSEDYLCVATGRLWCPCCVLGSLNVHLAFKVQPILCRTRFFFIRRWIFLSLPMDCKMLGNPHPITVQGSKWATSSWKQISVEMGDVSRKALRGLHREVQVAQSTTVESPKTFLSWKYNGVREGGAGSYFEPRPGEDRNLWQIVGAKL